MNRIKKGRIREEGVNAEEKMKKGKERKKKKSKR